MPVQPKPQGERIRRRYCCMVLAGAAIVTYAIGNIRFQKKDLPL